MARTIVVLCDVCLSESVESSARTLPAFGGKTIDLCTDHEVEVYKPLAELVDAFGIRADGSPVKRRKSPAAAVPSPHAAVAGPAAQVCPVCGRDYADKTRSAFMQHLKSKHDMLAGDLAAALEAAAT